MNKYKVWHAGDRLPSVEASNESTARLIVKENYNIPVLEYLEIKVEEVD